VKSPTPPKEAPRSQLTEEQVEQMQALLRDKRDAESTDPPEVLDQRVVENLALQYAAMNDALAMGRASKADREKLVQDSIQTAERITILRGVAAILRGRGYQVALAGPPANAFNVIGEDGQFLAAAAQGGAVRYAPGLAEDVQARITGDLADARQIVKDIILDEVKVGGPRISEKMMLSVWRRARAHVADAEVKPAPTSDALHPSPPAPAPVPAPTPTPTPNPESTYEDARSAIRALGLPAKKYAYFVRRAEEAIASGKGWAPVVARARRVADKLAGTPRAKKSPAPKPEARPTARPPAVDTTIDSFNGEPAWRAERLRPRANGFVLAVYPEGKDTDAAVASVDVVHGDIDEIRWLDDRLPQNDRDAITERLERALWDAYADDTEDEDDDAEPRPSPLQELIDLMDRRSSALGARPANTANLSRKDGYGPIAEALRDLARPTGPSADELQQWLESEDLMSAGEVVGRARGAESVVVRQLMREVWDGVFEVLTLEEVSGRPGAMVVPDEAIFHEDDHDFVLQRVRQGERVILRRLRVRVGDRDEETGVATIEEPTDRLTRGAEVHRAERTERFYVDLYGKLGSFHDDLERAPRTLQDVRTLLYWAAVMLDAPLCQGNVKARAAAAFTQAKAYHDTARRQLLEGRTVDAVRRMQEAMRRISAAAAEIARSCAEGQIDINVTPPNLPVSPEDKAAINGGDVETRP
jgi:hypothetical protein